MSDEASDEAPAEVIDPLAAARTLLVGARGLYEAMLAAEQAMRRDWHLVLRSAWLLGNTLATIKETVGHGKWLFWLGANWPEIDPRDGRRCMALFSDNPKAVFNDDAKSPDSGDLNPESVRKFMWGYIPQKERKALVGDEAIKREPHHLTFANMFWKFDRQLKLGSITADLSEIRRDLEPVVRRQIELLGRDWFEGLLKEG